MTTDSNEMILTDDWTEKDLMNFTGRLTWKDPRKTDSTSFIVLLGQSALGFPFRNYKFPCSQLCPPLQIIN